MEKFQKSQPNKKASGKSFQKVNLENIFKKTILVIKFSGLEKYLKQQKKIRMLNTKFIKT